MNIEKIKFYNYSLPTLNKTNFKGGYKDIAGEYGRNEFDAKVNNMIKNYRRACPFFLPEIREVEIDGTKAKLEIYKDKYYVLTSKNNRIKAAMKVINNEDVFECNNDFYSKNNGTAEIALIYSKGHNAGKFLIKEAVKRSFDMGYGGRVSLFACTVNYDAGSPVPFYHKMGFRGTDFNTEKQIEDAIEKSKITGLYRGPDELNMYLDPERINDYID